ncbi:hypothetical protein ASF84_12365 [Pseudomonas sp. Leaf127]|uniref:hypothetical protein n=1 Tax=Pseudomonas sp. Leaf127 TaxID=1736267 RepID=UPI0007026257|nr:hypothetical protein [Pseudomonas sp. Leaf127]KQQ56084.1 hypothetical protein ASF84_12365 [Pseudomonas sp. Leaf127]
MSKTATSPFIAAGGPLTAMGAGFIAVGLSGQPAFAYTGVGLLIPGLVMVASALWARRRRGNP